MLELIKKAHRKIAFSLSGIMSIVLALFALGIVALGIVYLVGDEKQKGLILIVISVLYAYMLLKQSKPMFQIYKYMFKPEEYPVYKKLIEVGYDISLLDKEIKEAHIIENLSKAEPFTMTENLVIGISPISFFILLKENIVWAYEYNGNGLVVFDKFKNYGYIMFKNVDGNDEAMAKLEHDLPYIYTGTDFDYKKVIHENFEDTLAYLADERAAFLDNPDKYRELVKEKKEALAKAETEKINKEIEEKLSKEKEEVIESDKPNEIVDDNTEEDPFASVLNQKKDE